MVRLKVRFVVILSLGQLAAIAPAEASGTPAATAAVGAIPLDNPGQWITTDDYPAAALKETRQGNVRFRLNVDVAGKVTGCTILVSSGSADLDQATCDLVSTRARFVAARDVAGHPQPGTYAGSVKWVIPGMPPPQPYRVVRRMIVEPDGTLTHCEITEAEGAAKQVQKVGDYPCYPTSFSDGYVDTTGKPVRRQVIYNVTVTTQDMSDPPPSH